MTCAAWVSSILKVCSTSPVPHPETGDTISDERRYEGWGWGGEIGMYLTTIGNVTSMFSATYQNVSAGREKGEDRPLLPLNQEVDLEGFGFLFSLGFGF